MSDYKIPHGSKIIISPAGSYLLHADGSTSPLPIGNFSFDDGFEVEGTCETTYVDKEAVDKIKKASEKLANKMGDFINDGFIVHDEVSVPNNLVNCGPFDEKPPKRTPGEWQLMKKNTLYKIRIDSAAAEFEKEMEVIADGEV